MAQQVAAIVALVRAAQLRRDRHRLRGPAGRRPAGLHRVRDASWPPRCTRTARSFRSRCSPRRPTRATPREPRAGLRGHRPGRRPGPAHGLRLPLGDLAARRRSRRSAGSARSCATPRPRSPPARSFSASRFYGYDWPAATAPRITWLAGHSAVPRSTTRRRSTTGEPGPLVPLHRTPPARAHRLVRERRELAGEVRGLAQRRGIGGVYLWMYGNADPGTWAALHHVLPARRSRTRPAPRSAWCVMPWWFLAIFVFGVNFTLWGTVGLARLAGPGTSSAGGCIRRPPARPGLPADNVWPRSGGEAMPRWRRRPGPARPDHA